MKSPSEKGFFGSPTPRVLRPFLLLTLIGCDGSRCSFIASTLSLWLRVGFWWRCWICYSVFKVQGGRESSRGWIQFRMRGYKKAPLLWNSIWLSLPLGRGTVSNSWCLVVSTIYNGLKSILWLTHHSFVISAFQRSLEHSFCFLLYHALSFLSRTFVWLHQTKIPQKVWTSCGLSRYSKVLFLRSALLFVLRFIFPQELKRGKQFL